MPTKGDVWSRFPFAQSARKAGRTLGSFCAPPLGHSATFGDTVLQGTCIPPVLKPYAVSIARPEGCRRGSVSRKQDAKIKGALPGLGQRAFLFQLLCLGMHKLHIAEELNRQIQLLLGYLHIACGLQQQADEIALIDRKDLGILVILRVLVFSSTMISLVPSAVSERV